MNYDFKDKDFKNLFLNCHGRNKDSDILRMFPILSKYDVFSLETKLNRNHLIRYIIYAFDRNSPLNAIDDLIEKRLRAVLLAGFEPSGKNKFPQVVENMIRSKDPTVNAMIVQYMILQANDDWLTLNAFQESIRIQTEKLMKGEVSEEKTKDMISNINTLREHIKTIKASLMNKDSDSALERSIYDFSESRKLRITPEDFASMSNASEEMITTDVEELIKQAAIQAGEKKK